MRILIGSDPYSPQIDGTSCFTQRLAAGLRARGTTRTCCAPRTRP